MEKDYSMMQNFKEPLPSQIKEWDELCTHDDIKKFLRKGIQIVNPEQFTDKIFRENKKEFDEFCKSKIKELRYQ